MQASSTKVNNWTLNAILAVGLVACSDSVTSVAPVSLPAATSQSDGVIAQQVQTDPSELLVVAGSNPEDYRVFPGEGWDGVVQITTPSLDGSPEYLCTGTVLWTGRHVATSANCLTASTPSLIVDTFDILIDAPEGQQMIRASEAILHPDWTGLSATGGGDLGILVLSAPVPPTIETYDLYRESAEVGEVFTKVSYGHIGIGSIGVTSSNPNRWKLAGLNRYDAFADVLVSPLYGAFGFEVGPPGSQLTYDFDNGLPENDAYGFFIGLPGLPIPDLGTGLDEVMMTIGDSGSPAFIDGKLAGLSSYFLNIGGLISPDITYPELDSSFGELAGDVRAAFYASWIDDVVAATSPTGPVLTSFTLIDSKSNRPIPGFDPIPATVTQLDLTNLPDTLSFRANTDPAEVGSVLMALTGPTNQTQLENGAPYALFGNRGDDYRDWIPTPPLVGSYTLTATPFSEANAQGEAGEPLIYAFEIVNSTPAISNFTLIDSKANRAIPEFDPIPEGAVLDLSQLPPKLSIQANSSRRGIARVSLVLSGPTQRVQQEGVAPYTLFGDRNGDYRDWVPATPEVGSYNLTATAFDALLNPLEDPFTLNFSIIDSSAP